MTRPKILILGNSHTRMMARALAARQQSGIVSSLDTEICWLTTPGRSAHGDTSREEALAKVRLLTPRDLLVLTWLGTAHNVAGLLEHEIPFSLVETVDGPVEPPAGAQIIPLNLMRVMLEEWIGREDVVSRYSEIAPCSVVHIMAPRPKEQVKPRPRGEDGAKPAEEMRFSAPQSRLAFWKLEASLVRRYVTGLGVRAYDHPDAGMDANGFLPEAFHAPDATHANAAYGELCLRDVEAMLAESAADQIGAAS